MDPTTISNTGQEVESLRRRLGELEQELALLRRGEQPAAASDGLSQVVFEEAGVGLAVISVDGRCRRVNRRLCQMLGYTQEQLLGMGPQDVFVDEELDAAQQSLRGVLAGRNVSQPIRRRFRRCDGSFMHAQMRAAPVRDADGQIRSVIYAIEDITDRLQAEEQLRRSIQDLQKLESLVNRSPVVHCIWRMAPGWPVDLVTENFAQFGYPASDLLSGKISYPGITHPDDIPRLEAEVNDFLARGQEEWSQQYRVVGPQGEIYWIEDRNKVIRDASGQITHIEGILFNITERKRSEDAHRTSEERYRTLVENLSVGIYRNTADDDGHFIQANSALANIHGFGSVQELMKVRVCDLYEHPADRQILLQQIRRHGQVRNAELRLRRADRTVIWASVTASAVRDVQGRILYVDGVVEDITQRKNAQEALRASEERFRCFAQSARDAIVSVNEAGKIVFWNQAAEEIFGYRSAEILGRPLTRIMPTRFRRFHRQQVLDRLARGGPIQVGRTLEASGLRKDKIEFPIEISLAQWRTAEGGFFTAIIRDISDRRRADEALRQSQDKLLTAREEERRRLAAELHDCLGQGLVALHLSIQGALTDMSGSAPSALSQAAQTCGELIREVRCISHGIYPPTLESLGLVSALRNLVAYCHSAKVQADLRCAGLDEGDRFDHATEIAFFRIAQEAVQNALRHGRADRVRIQLAYHEPKLTMAVEDNGVGFDPSSVSQGLGLLTMNDRARAIGGQLTIASSTGRTRVRLQTTDRPPRTASRP